VGLDDGGPEDGVPAEEGGEDEVGAGELGADEEGGADAGVLDGEVVPVADGGEPAVEGAAVAGVSAGALAGARVRRGGPSLLSMPMGTASAL
jgi:hypothetical protein